MEEAEVTLARAQRIYTLDNPLTVVKDEGIYKPNTWQFKMLLFLVLTDSSAGKPLYLTPDEMNALEHNSKH